jgi:hypothetical protein
MEEKMLIRNLQVICVYFACLVFIVSFPSPVKAQGVMAKAEKDRFRVIVDTHGLHSQYVYAASFEIICLDTQKLPTLKLVLEVNDIINAGTRYKAFVNKPISCLQFAGFGKSWIKPQVGKGDSESGSGWTGQAKPISTSASAQAADRISYTISNLSKYHVRLVFLPTGNTTELSPGKNKSCNSPIKNGQFPKVKAHASNGTTWLRTISNNDGDYYIINRGDTGIQIVP